MICFKTLFFDVFTFGRESVVVFTYVLEYVELIEFSDSFIFFDLVLFVNGENNLLAFSKDFVLDKVSASL